MFSIDPKGCEDIDDAMSVRLGTVVVCVLVCTGERCSLWVQSEEERSS